MKTIGDLSGVEFLRMANRIRKDIADPLKELDVIKVLRERGEEPSKDESIEERRKRVRKQTRKNISNALDICFEEKPETTIQLLDMLIIKDEHEELDGLDYMRVALEIFLNPKVIDFFILMLKSGLLTLED